MPSNGIEANVPIYLNQKIVFDLLATLNDGLSQMTRVTTKGEKEITVDGDLDGGLGNKNIFAFIGIALSANRKSTEAEIKEEEKIHTPSSLFNVLKRTMDEKQLIKTIKKEIDYKGIKEGDFIELEGVITTNPIIQALNGIKQMLSLTKDFEDNKSGKKAKKNKEMEIQIDKLINSLKTNGMQDLICTTEGEFTFQSVMPVYDDFFFNENMAEIVDGKFKVFAKVTKVCSEGEEINLFRNTSYTLLRKTAMEEIFKVMETSDEYFEINNMNTHISYPSLICLPIAIYR